MPVLEKQDLKFKGIDWELKRYASFTILSEELYDGTDVDLVKFFKEGRKDYLVTRFRGWKRC